MPAPKGNQNARTSRRGGLVVRLPGPLVDDLCEVLALDSGETVADGDDARLREYAVSLLTQFARRRLEWLRTDALNL